MGNAPVVWLASQGGLTSGPVPSIFRRLHGGAVAQLGERLVRNEEVRGSIPLSSTTRPCRVTQVCASRGYGACSVGRHSPSGGLRPHVPPRFMSVRTCPSAPFSQAHPSTCRPCRQTSSNIWVSCSCVMTAPVKSTKRYKVALPLQRDWSGRVALVSSRTAHLHD